VRANSIKDAALVAQSRRMADLVIEPAVRDVHWADFADYERCIDAGDAAASAALPQIKHMLRRERWLSVLRPGRGKKIARLYERAVNGEIHVE
jgi:predicted acylesterase/phospholipase RssA